jgi:hypothetical protein
MTTSYRCVRGPQPDQRSDRRRNGRRTRLTKPAAGTVLWSGVSGRAVCEDVTRRTA